MSVMNKPDYKIFAQDAKSGEYVAFPDILRGWGITLDQYNGFPPMELFNSAAKRIDEWLMYLTQRGLPEWDAAVDYPKDAMIQHAGVYYVSLKVTKGEQPNNSQASWKKLTEALGVDGKLDTKAVVQATGTSATNVMSQDATTKALAKKIDENSAASLLRLTTTSQDAIRMKSADYGVLLHQNNKELFILMTNEKDPDGNYNALRPFRIDLKTGEVSISSLTLGALNLQDFTPLDNRYLKKGTTATDLNLNYAMFVFDSNQTWAVPSEFIGRKAKVTVSGAGGGGSTKASGAGLVPRGGMPGGNGGMAVKITTLSASHTIVVGSPGNGGVFSSSSENGAGGGNGNSSSFDSVSATGGQGASSQAGVGVNNGTPGYGTGGDINIIGGGSSGGVGGPNNGSDPGNGRNGTKGYVIVEVMP